MQNSNDDLKLRALYFVSFSPKEDLILTQLILVGHQMMTAAGLAAH